ncbi:MAG TPA: Coenzyme F420 hydrogenase/dehydrogenase, beta subunit C-terminal domain [Thermoplasmata archaeon]|nr:Coenzyme F420 hydrogenase/dehydrogenase, beta subunit C-terminal domain [Thermoplasmata archaeon]
MACGGTLQRIDEYALDIAGQEVLFYADRCQSCGNEFVNAPKILRPDSEMIREFQPDKSLLGSYYRVLNLSSRDREFRQHPGYRVAGTLLWYLLEEDMADVVFLAHQSVTEEPVMAFTKKDLYRAWQLRMGAGRAVVTGSGLRANLLTLTQLKRFTEADRGLHPRIAVMGRPCQIYTVRKLLWDQFAPGYELAFGTGTFCYGNFSPGAWGGQKLREILGFDPGDIRQVGYVGEELEFTPSEGESKKVSQDEVAGLVNANCLQCYDFTARFSDVSVGHVGNEELFEAVIVRTEKGGVVVDQAMRDGFLAPSAQLYGKVDVTEEEQRTLSYLNAMVGIKKELTGKLR